MFTREKVGASHWFAQMLFGVVGVKQRMEQWEMVYLQAWGLSGR
jgi:hypothetical protein